MGIRFWNGAFSEIEITSGEWVFPLGIRVGDSEEHVYELLPDLKNRGETGWSYRHFEGDLLQLNYYVGEPFLRIYILAGKVERILWA
jgi:hypothetical protein